MRDLYKRIGLEQYSATHDDIADAIKAKKSAFPTDAENAEYVLLDASKKSVYDRTHKTLTTIGRLRARLDINNTDCWDHSEYGDFTFSPSVSSAKRKKRSPIKRFAIFAFVAIVLAGYMLFSDGAVDKSGTFRDRVENAYESIVAGSNAICRIDYEVETHFSRTEYAIVYGNCRAASHWRTIRQDCRSEAKAKQDSGLKQAQRNYDRCREEGRQGR